MYGKLLVLLMFAFCLIEVMDNKIPPLTFQGFFMMYLYCGSIIAIMCIYITVLLDNCPSVTNSRENLTTAGDPEVGSIGSLGTLKRAHISRNKVSGINIDGSRRAMILKMFSLSIYTIVSCSDWGHQC